VYHGLTERLLAIATGIGVGIASGPLIVDGRFGVLALGIFWCAIAMALSWAVIPADHRRRVLPLVGFATVLRAAIAVILYDGLIAAGRNGFLTGDDQGYADLSSRLARLLHGDAASFSYATEGYLLGTFVYLETALFFVIGPTVLVVELLNAAMGGLLVTFVFDIGRRIFQDVRAGTAAAILVALYPSLVLWSALNLKDSLALLLIAITVWLVARFREDLSLWLIPLSFAPVFLMETLRNYVFVVLALVVPASVIVAAPPHRRRRVGAAIISLSLAAVLLLDYFAFRPIPSLSDFEAERAAMGFGANTNFAVLCTVDGAGAVERTLRYGPCATLFVLFSPFPWSVSRTLDWLFVPEMVLWYLALAGAAVVVVRNHHLWPSLTPLIVLIGAMLVIFVLAEGNVGTLFRHRAMLIPFVLILASPAVVLLFANGARQPVSSHRHGDRVARAPAAEGRG
jgi:hypothetical protein